MPHLDPVKRREYNRKWKQSHPNYDAQKAKEYRERHPEQVKISEQKYREKNRDKIKQRTKLWREKNLNKVKTYLEKNKGIIIISYPTIVSSEYFRRCFRTSLLSTIPLKLSFIISASYE